MADGINRYNGFLNIYKEAGWTSMDVCAKLRGILGMRKIGHAGTLDPMAEGVLPVALGRATKDVTLVGDGTKTYEAGLLLGQTTDTQDVTGTVLSVYDGPMPDAEAVREAMFSFVGRYEQLTPMYSARKVNGKKLYEYARAGKEVERKSKQVEILSIEILSMDLPHVRFRVTCTKGTYVRTLCHDIGEKLQCGGCMESLLRTQVGTFQLDTALRLSQVEEWRDQGRVDEALVVKAPTAVALGKFDGTHVGHQALFRTLRRVAAEHGLRTCVLILDFSAKSLEDRSARKRELYAFGIDYVIELPLNAALMRMTAEDFLRKILLEKLNMHAIVAGKDVSFGYQKAGNAAFLKAHAEEAGYLVELIDKVELQLSEALPEAAGTFTSTDTSADASGTSDGSAIVVSSSRVREELLAGRMENAAVLLGKPYCLSGTVVHGRHLGQTVLGFPTMNINVAAEMLLPPFGVYAVRLRFADGSSYDGIANLGKKPTVTQSEEEAPVNLETYVFDYSGDAYGREISVALLKFIRPERKFRDLQELKEQLLEKDVRVAKQFLQCMGKTSAFRLLF